MPIIFFKRRFLLFPACKNILRWPFVFFAFLCSYKETLAKKYAKETTDKNAVAFLYVFSFGNLFRFTESLKLSRKTDERMRGVKFLLRIPEETFLCTQRKVPLVPFFGHLSLARKKGEKKSINNPVIYVINLTGCINLITRSNYNLLIFDAGEEIFASFFIKLAEDIVKQEHRIGSADLA